MIFSRILLVLTLTTLDIRTAKSEFPRAGWWSATRTAAIERQSGGIFRLCKLDPISSTQDELLKDAEIQDPIKLDEFWRLTIIYVDLGGGNPMKPTSAHIERQVFFMHAKNSVITIFSKSTKVFEGKYEISDDQLEFLTSERPEETALWWPQFVKGSILKKMHPEHLEHVKQWIANMFE